VVTISTSILKQSCAVLVLYRDEESS